MNRTANNLVQFTVTSNLVLAVITPLVAVTPTTYAPGVVPGLAGGLFTGGGAGLFAILPQPMSVPATTAKSSRARSVFNFRRRAGTPKKSTAARAMPPPTGTIRRSGSWTTEADAGVVLIVSVVVTGAVPEIVTGAEAEQLCKSVAFAGKTITAQVTPTDPVNPAAEVIVTVRSVRKNSRNPSLEAPKNANAHEHPAAAAALISASVQEYRQDCNLNCRQLSLWSNQSDALTVG